MGVGRVNSDSYPVDPPAVHSLHSEHGAGHLDALAWSRDSAE
jgi:hypothetical protein